MALLYSSSSGRRGQTSSAIVIVFVLTIFGALNVNILGRSIALSYVPLIGVCLWPRYANPVISITALFFLGLLSDFMTNEALGFHTLVYLTVFAVFRPDRRLKQHIFGTALARWLGTILVALLLVYALGWISRGVRPHVTTLLYQALLATTAFPIVYLCRHFLLYFLDSDDRF